MKNELLFCLLFGAILQSCQKSDDTSKVCLTNKSGHPVHFWAEGYNGHLDNFYENLCDYEIEQGDYFYWKADYPTIDPNDGQRTGALMIWEGGFTVDEDVNFDFTDQSGTLTYDFKDSKVGNYVFDCKLISSPQNEVLWVDTLTGTISKNAFLNQLEIKIDTFYSGTATFNAFPQIFKFSDGNTGSLYQPSQDEIEIRSIYTSYQKVCIGKKI